MQTVTGHVISLVVAILVFGALVGASFVLLRKVSPRHTIDNSKVEIDHRVVYLTLRVALTFAIGAAVVGVVIVTALLLQSWS